MIALAIVAAFLCSMLLCRAYLYLAQARHILDTPNERSSHSIPTPSGGGIALMLAFMLGLIIAAYLQGSWNEYYILLAVAALTLTVLGFIDDVRNLSMRLRLLVYSVVCLLVAIFLMQSIATGFALYVLVIAVAFILLWSLNLYNFMDGIDGIAALQAVLACGGAAWLSWVAGKDESYTLFCLLLASVHGGFLVWNCPRARLFMGDAGSVPTGFLLAGLALLGAVQGQVNPLCWLVLLSVFITDASWTLIWRMATGQSFTQPHRMHAYQRLSRHWGSHLKVDLLLLMINLLWLFPLAFVAQIRPDHAPILVILAYLPLLCGMAKIGRLA